MHKCAARGCRVEVPIAMLMCRPHWARVPKPIQRAVWATYRKGQESGAVPISPAYRAAMRDAIEAIPPVGPAAPPDADQGRLL